MTTAELHAHVHDEAGTTVIELAGDVDRNAEAALDEAYSQAGSAPSIVLDFSGVAYINSTGIAVIVGLLARARANGQAVERARADGALPPDLRDHQARGLHDHPRREGSGMTQTLSTSVRRVGNVAILDIEGEITATSEEALGEAYAEGADGGTRAVVLNFSRLEYMNSGGIGLLVTLLVRANRAKQQLLAFGLTDHYRQIFELTRLDEAIGIYDDEAAAVAAAG